MPVCASFFVRVCVSVRERVDARGKTRTCEQRDKTVFVLEKLGCVQALRENLLPFILNGIIFVRVDEKYDCRYAHAYWGLSTDVQKERETAQQKSQAKAAKNVRCKEKNGETRSERKRKRDSTLTAD